MNRVFRWMIRAFVAVSVLAVIFVGLVYYLASRSLPDYDASHEVAGLNGPVRIVRSTTGVPHIFGETEADSFFGLGFVHAQDRLWQMMLMRRTAQGRLSEMFGSRTVKTDEVLRRFDLYRLAAQSVQAQDAPTRDALEAYSAGVNAWIGEVNKGALGRGAPEFFLFNSPIAPWQPADSIAVAKIMALKLMSHLPDEVLRARTALSLRDTPEKLLDILPDAPGPGVATLPDLAWLDLPMQDQVVTTDFRSDPLSPAKPLPFAGASNAWAAAPKRSASNGTLLANDPHLGFSAPSIWYLARMEIDQGGVIGGTIPGMPLILIGRSDDIAWGLTSAYVDDVDVYIERLNPENASEYEQADGTYKPFLEEHSIVQIKDAAPITLTLQWTDRGPVLPPDVYDLGLVTPRDHVTSVAWTALRANDGTMTAAMNLMRATSVSEALEAGKGIIAPAQNLTVVDRNQIALQVIGAIPRRSALHDSLGRLPSPGWRSVNHWQGDLDYDLNPRFRNPSGGILGNTNNKIIDRPFPLHVSYKWGDTERVRRWSRLMQERSIHSRESFVEAQLDTVSISARTLLPLVGAELWYAEPASDELSKRRAQALSMLADWNGEMNEHMAEPLIYAAWMRFLQQRLIMDELGGELAAEFVHPDPVFLERVYRNVDGAAAWCDVRQSNDQESCPEIARRALDDALVFITDTYGAELNRLHWGDAHQATHDHEVLGSLPAIGWLVNIRQSTSGGDNTLLRGLTSGTLPHPFRNTHGAGYRGVYDMADPDSSLFVISTGQSGHPLSRFYDNLGDLWRRGEYIQMSLDPELAEAAPAGVMSLTPAPE